MTSVDGVGYTFDDNGNLLATSLLTNTFDAANRLIETTRAGTTLQPSYDGLGNRVGQTVGLSTTTFALDGQGLPEVIYTSAGNAYLHLPGVIMTENATGTVRYLLSDGLGSVRQAVDENASVMSYKEFDPYGHPVKSSEDAPYGFTGEWWEAEVGLLYLRARWYWPETGSFVSQDPWPGDVLNPQSLNPYGYVGHNPINLTDPSGNCYPPLAFLRSVERVVCENLDQAIYIYKHPNASLAHRAAASFYLSTWAVSHASVIVGTSIAGGEWAYSGAGAIANWGLRYLTVHPALAKVVGYGTIAASTGDDVLTAALAVSGDIEAANEIITASMIDGELPFADVAVVGGFLGKRGRDLFDNIIGACQADPRDFFEPHEITYMERALSGDLDDLLNNIECHGSSLCRGSMVGGLYMMPTLDKRTGEFVLEADPRFKFEGILGENISSQNLQPGDLLIYHDKSAGRVSTESPIKILPVHSNRLLGSFEDDTLILFDKANVGKPFAVTTLSDTLSFWKPEFVTVYRPK